MWDLVYDLGGLAVNELSVPTLLAKHDLVRVTKRIF